MAQHVSPSAVVAAEGGQGAFDFPVWPRSRFACRQLLRADAKRLQGSEAAGPGAAGRTVAGLAGYGTLAAMRYPSGSVVFAGWEWLVGLLGMTAAVVALLLLHEGIHVLAMLRFDAHPSFGVGVAGGVLPYASSQPGHLFSRVGT